MKKCKLFIFGHAVHVWAHITSGSKGLLLIKWQYPNLAFLSLCHCWIVHMLCYPLTICAHKNSNLRQLFVLTSVLSLNYTITVLKRKQHMMNNTIQSNIPLTRTIVCNQRYEFTSHLQLLAEPHLDRWRQRRCRYTHVRRHAHVRRRWRHSIIVNTH